MNKQERIAYYQKELGQWTIKAYAFLNKCDHVNYLECMAIAERYEKLLEKAKAM